MWKVESTCQACVITQHQPQCMIVCHLHNLSYKFPIFPSKNYCTRCTVCVATPNYWGSFVKIYLPVCWACYARPKSVSIFQEYPTHEPSVTDVSFHFRTRNKLLTCCSFTFEVRSEVNTCPFRDAFRLLTFNLHHMISKRHQLCGGVSTLDKFGTVRFAKDRNCYPNANCHSNV